MVVGAEKKEIFQTKVLDLSAELSQSPTTHTISEDPSLVRVIDSSCFPSPISDL